MEPDPKLSEDAEQANGLDQASISELMRLLSDQVSTLARKEVELAKAEVTEKGKRLGVSAGAFGAAGIVALFALGALTAALILALESVVAAWLAALIVAAAYGLIAGGLALAAKQKAEAGSPPVPERAIESTKLDIEAAKAGAKEGRNG
jgi:Putative Actinobacterial Holin-X, holin superfamily III